MQIFVDDIPEIETPRRATWTRAELERIEELGILEDREYELIDGELFEKMGKNPPHAIAVHEIVAWLSEVFGYTFVNHDSIAEPSIPDAAISRPEPDVFVLTRPVRDVRTRHPRPTEIRLLIEASNSTVKQDLGQKAALYARAEIQDYWVLDTKRRRMVVHRDPEDGQYRTRLVVEEHESIAPLAAPDKLFPVAHALLPIE